MWSTRFSGHAHARWHGVKLVGVKPIGVRLRLLARLHLGQVIFLHVLMHDRHQCGGVLHRELLERDALHLGARVLHVAQHVHRSELRQQADTDLLQNQRLFLLLVDRDFRLQLHPHRAGVLEVLDRDLDSRVLAALIDPEQDHCFVVKVVPVLDHDAIEHVHQPRQRPIASHARAFDPRHRGLLHLRIGIAADIGHLCAGQDGFGEGNERQVTNPRLLINFQHIDDARRIDISQALTIEHRDNRAVGAELHDHLVRRFGITLREAEVGADVRVDASMLHQPDSRVVQMGRGQRFGPRQMRSRIHHVITERHPHLLDRACAVPQNTRVSQLHDKRHFAVPMFRVLIDSAINQDDVALGRPVIDNLARSTIDRGSGRKLTLEVRMVVDVGEHVADDLPGERLLMGELDAEVIAPQRPEAVQRVKRLNKQREAAGYNGLFVLDREVILWGNRAPDFAALFGREPDALEDNAPTVDVVLSDGSQQRDGAVAINGLPDQIVNALVRVGGVNVRQAARIARHGRDAWLLRGQERHHGIGCGRNMGGDDGATLVARLLVLFDPAPDTLFQRPDVQVPPVINRTHHLMLMRHPALHRGQAAVDLVELSNAQSHAVPITRARSTTPTRSIVMTISACQHIWRTYRGGW